MIEVWNKIDRLSGEDRAQIDNMAARADAAHRPILVSALTGEGIDTLLAGIEDRLSETRLVLDLVAISVRADPAKAGQVRARIAATALAS